MGLKTLKKQQWDLSFAIEKVDLYMLQYLIYEQLSVSIRNNNQCNGIKAAIQVGQSWTRLTRYTYRVETDEKLSKFMYKFSTCLIKWIDTFNPLIKQVMFKSRLSTRKSTYLFYLVKWIKQVNSFPHLSFVHLSFHQTIRIQKLF